MKRRANFPNKSKFSARHKIADVMVIKNHLTDMDNDSIKKALIANGIYDVNMKLTASFK